jgi:uncharacterized membrane protein YeaQ/YmgE (transglycosylase-associated protein family)
MADSMHQWQGQMRAYHFYSIHFSKGLGISRVFAAQNMAKPFCRELGIPAVSGSPFSENTLFPLWEGLLQHASITVSSAGQAEYTAKKLRRCNMSFIAWIVLGLIAGFIGSKLVNHQGEGIFLDIILGVVGAIVGGWLFTRFGAQGVSGVNLYSIFVAVIGSVVFLVAYHAIRRTV